MPGEPRNALAVFLLIHGVGSVVDPIDQWMVAGGVLGVAAELPAHVPEPWIKGRARRAALRRRTLPSR